MSAEILVPGLLGVQCRFAEVELTLTVIVPYVATRRASRLCWLDPRKPIVRCEPPLSWRMWAGPWFCQTVPGPIGRIERPSAQRFFASGRHRRIPCPMTLASAGWKARISQSPCGAGEEPQMSWSDRRTPSYGQAVVGGRASDVTERTSTGAQVGSSPEFAADTRGW